VKIIYDSNMGALSLDSKKLMRFNPSDVEFTENGKLGWKTNKGEILIPAEYDQIEKCADALYLRKGNSYELYFRSGNAECYSHFYEEGSFFVKNKKFGWRKADKVIIPAIYDYIHSWGDYLFVVKLDGKHFYVNEKNERVLTNIRHFDGEDEEEIPFNFSVSDNRVLTISEYVGHEVKNDSNVVKMDTWVRLDRFSYDEIMQMLINPDDEAPIDERELENYNSQFSYEFNGYLAKSKAKSGIKDCLSKMGKMCAYSNSWFYIIKVWKAEGEEPTAEELRYLRYFIEGKNRLGSIVFALGYDSNLKAGETKMLMLTHYNEECFPPSFQFDWYEYVNEHTLSEIKQQMKVQRKTVEEHILSDYIEEVWQNHFTGIISDMRYCESRSWEETTKVLDFFKQYDDSYQYCVKSTVDSFFNYFEANSLEADEFLLNKLRWLLENGSDINAHNHNKTALDVIRENTSTKNELHYNAESIERCLELLHQYGAKTIKDIQKEESEVTDYRVELEILKPIQKKYRTFGVIQTK
jgi:hypothetical protein